MPVFVHVACALSQVRVLKDVCSGNPIAKTRVSSARKNLKEGGGKALARRTGIASSICDRISL